MASVTQRYVLVGPHRGKTMMVNGHRFVDGEYEYTSTAEILQGLSNVFESYGALAVEAAERLAQATEIAALKAQLAQVAPASATQVVGSTAIDQPQAEDAKPTLAEAIGQLDPENAGHWTSNNLPALDHLEGLIGKKVARGDVEAIAEGYTRAKAKAARG